MVVTTLLCLVLISSVASAGPPHQTADAIGHEAASLERELERHARSYQRFLRAGPGIDAAREQMDAMLAAFVIDAEEAIADIGSHRQSHPGDEEVAKAAEDTIGEIRDLVAAGIDSMMSAFADYRDVFDPEPSPYLAPGLPPPTTTVPSLATTTAAVPGSTTSTSIPPTATSTVPSTLPRSSTTENVADPPPATETGSATTTISTPPTTTITTLVLALPEVPDLPASDGPGTVAPIARDPAGELSVASPPDRSPVRAGDRAAVIAAVHLAEAAWQEPVRTPSDGSGPESGRRLSATFVSVQASIFDGLGEPMADLLTVFKALLAAVASGLRVIGVPWLIFSSMAMGFDRWRRQTEESLSS